VTQHVPLSLLLFDAYSEMGGDMSTPQKCPHTGHYLQKTSDNRLNWSAAYSVAVAAGALPKD
jgi:hypothetical protein